MDEQGNKAAPRRSAYAVFVLLMLMYLLDYVDRMMVASLFPFLKRDWGLSDTECGLLVSAVYWSIIIFSIPASVLVDRWSRKNSIGLMGLLWSLATGACAFTRSFGQLFTAKAFIGLGEAGYAPGGTAMISALFPPKRRALMLGIWTAMIPLGSAIGIGLGGVIASTWGWRYAFGLVAIPGIIVSTLFFFTRDYKSVELVKAAVTPDVGGGSASGEVRMSKRDIVREFTGTPSLLLTYFGFAANTFVTTALLTWMPTFFHRTQGVSEAKAGMMSGGVMLFAIVGAPLGGYLADRWHRGRPNARLLLPACTSAMTGLALAVAFGLLEGDAQYGMLMVVGCTAPAFVAAAAAVTQDVVHPGLRATSYSLCVIVQNLLGSSLGPLFIGAASDRIGIASALTLLSLFSFLGAGLFLLGARFYERDLAKVAKVEVQFS
jgi:MFS family permease